MKQPGTSGDWNRLFRSAVAVLSAGVLAVSCGRSNGPGTASGTGQYGVKSGILHQETETMGMKIPSVVYFDDFGRKQCTETVAEMTMMGIATKIHTRDITYDGGMYKIDMDKKTGQHFKVSGMPAPGSLDFSRMSEDMTKAMGIRKVGTENYLGLTCDKFTVDNPDMKMKGEYLTYKNVPLKADISMGELKTLVTGTKFEENVPVPADLFNVPSDVKLEVIDLGGPK